MSRREAAEIVRRARSILASRGFSRGGPMRNADGSHATRFAHAKALSVIGALMAAADELAHAWAVGSADEAVQAVHRAACPKGQKGRHYVELADANDALGDDGHAVAIVWLTRAVGILNEGRRGPRAVDSGGEAA